MTSLSSAFLRTAGQTAFAAFALSALPDCGAPAPTPPSYDSGWGPPSNRCPSFTNLQDQTAYTGVQFQNRFTASDPDGDRLTFSLGNNPPSGAYISNAGWFTWTPSRAGTRNVEIIVNDGTCSVPGTFTIETVQSTTPPPPVDAGMPPERDAGTPPPIDAGPPPESCFRPADNAVTALTRSLRLCAGTYTNARMTISDATGLEIRGDSPIRFLITDSNSAPIVSIQRSTAITWSVGGDYEATRTGFFTAVSITNTASTTVSGGRFLGAIRVLNSNVFHLSDVAIDTPQRRACLRIDGGSDHDIRRVFIQNCGGDTSLDEQALYVSGTTNATFDIVNVTNSRNGIKFDGVNTGLRFMNGRIHRNGSPLLLDAVVLVYSSGIRMSDCYVTDNFAPAINALETRGSTFSGNDLRRNTNGPGDLNCSQNTCTGNSL